MRSRVEAGITGCFYKPTERTCDSVSHDPCYITKDIQVL